jgi:hypothetical protein
MRVKGLPVKIILIVAVLLVFVSCKTIADYRIKQIAQPPPTTKVRILVLTISGVLGGRYWQIPHKEWADAAGERIAHKFRNIDICDLIPHGDISRVISEEPLYWQWESQGWDLAKKVGRALHADYLLIQTRESSGVGVSRTIWISLQTEKKIELRETVTTQKGRDKVEKNAREKIFNLSKEELLAFSAQKRGTPVDPGSIKQVATLPAASPAEKTADKKPLYTAQPVAETKTILAEPASATAQKVELLKPIAKIAPETSLPISVPKVVVAKPEMPVDKPAIKKPKEIAPPIAAPKEDNKFGLVKKESSTFTPVKEPVKVAAIPVEEKSPPKILIVSPDVTNKKSVISREYSMTISGKVESKMGLAVVLINGYPVNVDDKGNFSENVFLKIGKNNIVVTAIDVHKNQVKEDFIVNRERVQVAKALPIDAGVPKVVIVSPDSSRAVSVVPDKSSISVIGVAESKIGIAEVLINGQHANIDDKGNFSGNVLLKVGHNDITVTAIDILNNQETKKFVVNREAAEVALVKKVEPVLEAGLMSGKYYALVIAIQEYASREINKLDHPVSDAKKLMETLVTRYTFDKENIIFLENPHRRSIFKAFQDLRIRLTEKDNLLVFYAGHGTWMDDMQQGFWLPQDAAGPTDPSNWISNSTVRDYIKSFKAKHVLLVADACFSGGIFKMRTVFIDPKISFEKIYELPSRKAITSGSLKTVPDRSVFVDFLVKRLNDNRDPYLDTQKLFASLREAVINNSVTNQTPLYGAISEAGDEGGDFVFVKRR